MADNQIDTGELMDCLVQNKHQKEMNEKCAVGVTHFQLVRRIKGEKDEEEQQEEPAAFFNPPFVSTDPDQRFPFLLQVQDGLQGGRPQAVSQHQEEVRNPPQNPSVLKFFLLLCRFPTEISGSPQLFFILTRVSPLTIGVWPLPH